MKTGYTVMDVMTTKPITASQELSLKDAAILMQQSNVNSLPIIDKDIAIGVITDEDFVRQVVAKGADSKKLKIKDVMSKDVISIQPEKDIYDALLIMRAHSIRQLPVTDKSKKLIGYLTMKDVLKIQPDLFELIAERYDIRESERKFSEKIPTEDEAFFKRINIFKKRKK